MTNDRGMDVEVEVDGWDHECCGDAIERNQVVDFACLRFTGDDGQVHLSVVAHFPTDEQVRGRVCDIQVVRPGASSQPILRVPSGLALRGFDPDDGHLEDPWTGEPVAPGHDFLVTIRPSR